MADILLDLDELPVLKVPVGLLRLGESPRSAGCDEQNVRMLAELDCPWPPLLVHRQTYRVIDGMHRLLAARMRGDETVEVRFHECDEAEAFVLAVRANVAHGLPLSLNDRKAAAGRIIASRPEWSDRRVAMVAGLSDKTVAAIRRIDPVRAADRGGARIGTDGRSRPVDASSRRAMVTQLLVESPESSLRQIADRAGVSPETVRSVRSGLERRRATGTGAGVGGRGSALDPRRGLRMLAGDPALRSSEAGRLLLRVLSTLPALEQGRSSLVEAIPEHDLAVFERLAMANAAVWHSLARLAASRETRETRRPSVAEHAATGTELAV
jgi:hypothetical protein